MTMGALTRPEATKIKRSEMGPGGLFVMIRHKHKLISAYMHLVRYEVKVGQQVKEGQPAAGRGSHVPIPGQVGVKVH